MTDPTLKTPTGDLPGTATAIPLFRPFFRVDECLDEIRVCLERGWTGSGFKTLEFEEQWKSYTGLPHAHFVNSASAGLHLGVKILKSTHGWSDGDEIITTPLSFVSTNHAILHERLHCVFADVDDSLNLSPASVAARMTAKTRAIMFVGVGGSVDNLVECQALARKHGLAFILDAAHMCGSTVGGRHVGFETDATVFSFQAVKNCPSADGGTICFADPKLDGRARKLAWLGIDKDTYARNSQAGYDWQYDVDEVGHNYHGNSVIAALALVSLRYVEQDNARRRQLASRYEEQLSGEPGITIVRHKTGQSSRHLFQVMVDAREAVLARLREHGIHAGVHYRIHSDYLPYRNVRGDCPVARSAASRLLSLPLHMHLTNEECDHVGSSLKSVVRASLRP